MMTTAGALALEGNIAPRDAFVVQKLRAAGVDLLGKTNMSEWGYMRSTRACSGWSRRGGQTRNPYVLDRSPLGSSSGSAVAMAADLCTAAIGAEVDGSIVRPASTNSIVGLKPTVALVSRSGIIGVADPQDSAASTMLEQTISIVFSQPSAYRILTLAADPNASSRARECSFWCLRAAA
jgi:amidase